VHWGLLHYYLVCISILKHCVTVLPSDGSNCSLKMLITFYEVFLQEQDVNA